MEPTRLGYYSITQILDKGLQQVIDGKATPAQAMKEAQQQADEILAQYRK